MKPHAKMNNTTKSILKSVKSDLEAIRKKMENYMYGGEKALETEDFEACRRAIVNIDRTLSTCYELERQELRQESV